MYILYTVCSRKYKMTSKPRFLVCKSLAIILERFVNYIDSTYIDWHILIQSTWLLEKHKISRRLPPQQLPDTGCHASVSHPRCWSLLLTYSSNWLIVISRDLIGWCNCLRRTFNWISLIENKIVLRLDLKAFRHLRPVWLWKKIL